MLPHWATRKKASFMAFCRAVMSSKTMSRSPREKKATPAHQFFPAGRRSGWSEITTNISGCALQQGGTLFVCRSSAFDCFDPHDLLLIVDLVKNAQIAHAETMHMLEITLQFLDMIVAMGIPAMTSMASSTRTFNASSAFR